MGAGNTSIMLITPTIADEVRAHINSVTIIALLLAILKCPLMERALVIADGDIGYSTHILTVL